MSASEKIIEGLNQQTYAERIVMATFLRDLISDYAAENTELPSAEVVAGWLEILSEHYLSEDQ